MGVRDVAVFTLLAGIAGGAYWLLGRQGQQGDSLAKVIHDAAPVFDLPTSPMVTLPGLFQDAPGQFQPWEPTNTPITSGLSDWFGQQINDWEFIMSNDNPLQYETAPPVTVPGGQNFLNDTSQPFGIRGNNGGNLRAGAAWKGLIGENRGFAVFDTPENGLRAMLKNVSWIQRKRGAGTLREIFHIYAPTADNNQPNKYAQFVADQVGISPDDPFNINTTDTGFLARFVKAVVKMENGKQPYSDATIQGGIQGYLGG